MNRYLDKFSSILVLGIILGYTTTVHCNDGNLVKALLVKDKNISDSLKKETKKNAPLDSDVELKQIVKVKYSEDNTMYIVPVVVNENEPRGCYVYSFDQKLRLTQKLILSKLEELESCETFSAIFACNRDKGNSSGIGVLYAKRLGGNNYWFEGSYLIIDDTGRLIEEPKLSERLVNVDTVAKAKKKLGCR